MTGSVLLPSTIRAAVVTPKISHFEVPLLRLAATLRGVDLRVFSTDDRGDAPFDPDFGTTTDWGEQRRAGFPSATFANTTALSEALFRWSPHIVLQYGYLWPGALRLLARLRLAGIPVVHRGPLTPYYNTRQNPLVTRAWRLALPLLLRRFSAHHFGGSYSATVLDQAGIAADRRYFVPYSVDTDHFAAQADDPEQFAAAARLRHDLGWARSDPVLLFMCQHSWFKAPDVMLQIAAEMQRRLPATKLIMAGSGVMTDELKAIAAKTLILGSVHFPGYVSSKRTMPVYLASDVVLFPSRYDTWSRGVNEAMLARRPCVVSRIVPAAGGLVEHGENGFVVDGLDPVAFADRVSQFLALPAERRVAMGEAAHQRARFFSYEAHASELRASLVETAQRHAGRVARHA